MATAKTHARKASSTKSPARSDDAIAMLTNDHKEVKALFKEYDKLVEADAEDDERQAIAEQICQMLTVHAAVEEEIFYPAAREALGEEEDLIDEADVEHATAKDLIAQLEGSSPAEDALYDAKVKVLGRVHRPSRQGRGRRDLPEGQEGQARHRRARRRDGCAQGRVDGRWASRPEAMKKTRSVPAKAAARNTAARPSKPMADTGGDALAEQAAQTQELVASLPFNTTKASEYAPSDATRPPVGQTAPATPAVGASTLSERNASPKTSEGPAPMGSNATIGTLDRVRADGSGQALTTNQGVLVADNQNSLKAGPARAGAARRLHPAREDHPLRP